MKALNRFPSLRFDSHGVSLFVAGLFTLVWVGCSIVAPIFLFAYAQDEYLNLLFSDRFPHSDFLLWTNETLPPVQNLNLLVVLLLWIGRRLPLSPAGLLVFAQTALCAALLYRYSILIRRKLQDDDPLPYFLLLIFHPGLWLTLLFSPSLGLTALLLIEALIRFPEDDTGSAGWYTSLLLLSASGAVGYYFALLTALIAAVTALPLCRPFLRFRGTAHSAILSLTALTPMSLFYLVFTLESGVPGGPLLSDFPTLFSGLSVYRLLNGEWTQHFRVLLSLFGNGCIDTWIPLPFFGIMVLSWVLTEIVHKKQDCFFPIVFTFLLGLSLLVFAFAPEHAAQAWFFPLLPPAMIAAYQGFRRLAEHGEPYQVPVRWTGIGALIFISFTAFPASLEKILSPARYRLHIYSTIQKTIRQIPLTADESIAADFDPAIFSRMPREVECIPLGLTIRNLYRTPLGIQGKMEWTFENGLSFAPKLILRFPDYDAAVQGNQPPPIPVGNQKNDLPSSFYEISRQGGLELWIRKSDSKDAPQSEILRHWRETGKAEECEPAYSRLNREHRSNPNESYTGYVDEEKRRRVGMEWNLEVSLENTRAIGLAFGLSPGDLLPYGTQNTADPGVRAENREMGTLESVPFVVEGDELCFVADCPKDSTASLFCLAVYQTVPFGENQSVKQAQHIFDHRPDESLSEAVFFYLRPEQVSYSPGNITGWRVVQALHGGRFPGRNFFAWNLETWKNRQAVWLAADRDTQSRFILERIYQRKRK